MWLHSDMWRFMPEINTVIREIVFVRGLKIRYWVEDILEIEEGYKGFHSKK